MAKIDGMVTAAEAAAHLCIHRTTFWRWTKDENFPKPTPIGRQKFYRLVEIDEWLGIHGDESIKESKNDD